MLRSRVYHPTGFAPPAQRGFTIIEIMIVLVIVAAIILTVFLAVPAVQRNSRNNSRKNDAGRVLSAAQEWRTHNNNAFPHCNDMIDRSAGTIPPCAIRTAIETMAGKLNHYEHIWSVNQVEFQSIMYEVGSLAHQDVLNVVGDAVLVRSAAVCGPNNNLQPGSGLVVLYSQETSSGLTLHCEG